MGNSASAQEDERLNHMAHDELLLAKNPCGSCPYRQDVPSGLWHSSEYAKLPRYDLPTGEQPAGLFSCHQQEEQGRLCSGWAGCHDMGQTLAVRVAVISGRLSGAQMDELLDYRTDVPLFESGAEAAVHGLRDLAEPSPRAQRAMDKLTRRAELRQTEAS
jgi:hypothetical protein